MHLTMSVLLFLVSSMAAGETQPELEPGCLLQRTHSEAKHAAVPISPIPNGFRSLCPADPNLDCRCAQHRPGISASFTFEQCASRCGSASVFEYRHEKLLTGIRSYCECCGDVPQGSTPWEPTSVHYPWTSASVYTAGDALSGVEGDPHVRTLDGGHYTLLSQGTFSLWRFSGVHANFMSKDSLAAKLEVDWQVYTHYSGHRSYTKGLLILDRSGGRLRQALEITSKDCQWKSKTPEGNWSKVQDIQMLSVPEGDAFATGFKINPAKNRNRVSFVMKDGGNRAEIAVLSISCRSGHSINVAIKMKRASDSRFVNGELRVGRNSTKGAASMLQADEEFAVQSPWQILGGSPAAAWYLKEMDVPSGVDFLSCSDEQQIEAQKLCSKHLGDPHNASGVAPSTGMATGHYNHFEAGAEADFFNDCVFDTCRGGEVEAELAAELLAVTRAL